MTNDSKVQTWVGVIDSDSGKAYGQPVKLPRPITDYLTCFSAIPAATLDPVIMTLPYLQACLHTLINSSITLLGRSLESDLHPRQLSYLRCISTAILSHHPHGRPLKPRLDRGLGGYDPEKDARACGNLLKAGIQ
ncbi:hypothetical protein EDB87DRAFT_1540806, partial [Lactarius vividus]